MADSPITNEQIEYLRRQYDALETQERLPLPTPEVGRWVWFYRQGDTDSQPIPALVQRQSGPGQVDLEVHPFASQVHPHVTGVHFKDHPFLETNPQVAKMKGSGVWAYRDGDKPTQAHGQIHLAQLKQQMKDVQKNLLKAREDEIRRQQRDKDMAASTAPEKSSKADKATASAAS